MRWTGFKLSIPIYWHLFSAYGRPPVSASDDSFVTRSCALALTLAFAVVAVLAVTNWCNIYTCVRMRCEFVSSPIASISFTFGCWLWPAPPLTMWKCVCVCLCVYVARRPKAPLLYWPRSAMFQRHFDCTSWATMTLSSNTLYRLWRMVSFALQQLSSVQPETRDFCCFSMFNACPRRFIQAAWNHHLRCVR